MSSPDSRSPIEVAVIGAGAAGIAAARRLAEHGLPARVYEAADRVGGRALTSASVLGAPFDHGCAWLHSAGINPLRALADQYGFAYGGEPEMAYAIDGRLLGEDGARRLTEAWHRDLEAIRTAGRHGDPAAAAVLDPGAAHAPIRDYLLTAINGVGPGRYACAELAAEEDTHEDWIMRDGLGRLVERLADGLDIASATPVHTIEHDQRGVRLATGDGSITARCAIVTVSTGNLAGGGLEFDPPLPAEKQAALERLPMGIAEKVALRFANDPFGLADDTFVTLQHGPSAMGFHLVPGDERLAVAYGGGELGRWMTREPPDTVIGRCVELLTATFGDAVRDELISATRTAWLDDPLVRGSYSAAVPGGHASRAVLARPVGGSLFFAGEATEPRRFASVHGAWHSGERAAAEVLGRFREFVAGPG